MRLADISGGLLKMLTGIDPSKGIVPSLLERDNILGGLAGMTGTELDPRGMIKIPGMSPFPVAEPEPKNILMPYPLRKGSNDFDQLRGRPPSPYAYTHGIADFDGYGMPTYDLPGGPITPQEMAEMNRKYPIPGSTIV